jgi:hypothetical protein
MNIYRKIYEQNFGPIPVDDDDGHSYDIHHIDGDHSNNDPSNLKAVTIQEHYDIHHAQGDYYACYLIAIQRMSKDPDEVSSLAREVALARVANGTHPWQLRPDGTSFSSDRVNDGTHNLLKRHDGTSVSSDRIKAGTHNFQIKWKCEHCNKEGIGQPNYLRWHGDRCKFFTSTLVE